LVKPYKKLDKEKSLQMFKKIIFLSIGLMMVLSIVACFSAPSSISNNTQKPTQVTPNPAPTSKPATVPDQKPAAISKPFGPIKAKWIDVSVDGSTVSFPVSEVEKNWNTHFKVQVNGSTENFMAYNLDGTIYVRANVCPPCKSVGFSLDKDILVCDRCSTTFKADTGAGIKGACVNYPKASVPNKVVNGNVTLNETDLVKAYQETLKPG